MLSSKSNRVTTVCTIIGLLVFGVIGFFIAGSDGKSTGGLIGAVVGAVVGIFLSIAWRTRGSD